MGTCDFSRSPAHRSAAGIFPGSPFPRGYAARIYSPPAPGAPAYTAGDSPRPGRHALPLGKARFSSGAAESAHRMLLHDNPSFFRFILSYAPKGENLPKCMGFSDLPLKKQKETSPKGVLLQIFARLHLHQGMALCFYSSVWGMMPISRRRSYAAKTASSYTCPGTWQSEPT